MNAVEGDSTGFGSSRSAKSRIVLLALLIFVCGIVSGVVGTIFVARARIQQTLTADPEIARGLGRKVVLGFLDRRLDLDAAQRTRIDRELSSAQEDLAILRSRIGPEVRSSLERHYQAIRTILSPEQQVRFEEIYRKLLVRFERYHRWGEELATQRESGA